MNSSHKAAIRTLARVVKPLAAEQEKYLDRLRKRRTDWRRPDFIWHYLLQSMATMGRAAAWLELKCNPKLYQRITFEALDELKSPSARRKRIQQTFRAAKITYPNKKAEWLNSNFEFIRSEWNASPATAKKALEKQKGMRAKITFLKRFAGISDKYARNIMMDVYHPEFRNCVAVDRRITRISKALGLQFKKYEEHEQFFIRVANEIGIEPWALDRIMFRFADEVVCGIKEALAKQRSSSS